jgi:hypothetical protein
MHHHRPNYHNRATPGRLCYLAVAAGLFFGHGAQGSLLLQDSFNFTSGGALAGQGTWATTTNSAFITVGSGSLTYPGLADVSPSGNRAVVSGQSETVGGPASYTYSPFSGASQSGAGTVVYASFLLNVTAVVSGDNYTFLGMLPYAASGPGNGGNFNSTYDPIDLACKFSATGQYTLGIRSLGQGASFATTALPINTTELIVLKYDFTAKKASLFINPALASEPGTAEATSTGSAMASSLDQVYIRNGGTSLGVASQNYEVDAIRVGSTWAEVTPQAPIAPAARLGFTTGPSAGTAGATMARVVVQALDANTNNVATNNVPITLNLDTGLFAGGSPTACTDAAGKAVFNNLVVNVPGTYAITASASGIGAGLSPATISTFEIGPTNAISEQGQALSVLLDSLQVERYWAKGVSVNWLTGAEGGSGPNMTTGTVTHCSAFAPAVAYLVGVYLLRPPDKSDVGLANNQADWLRTNSVGWYLISSMTNAQHLANTGILVVASYKDPTTSGHIAVVRPSTRSDADVQAYGPQECQSGVNNYNSTNIIAGFDQHDYAFPDGIRYYGHAVTGSIPSVNPEFGSPSLSNNVFRADATTIVGRKYVLQCSSEFTAWSNVLAFTNSNNSSNFFCLTPLADSTATGAPRRFYRLLAR